MHQIRFRLGLRPRPRWGSLQRSPRPPSWFRGCLLLREGRGRGGGRAIGEKVRGGGGLRLPPFVIPGYVPAVRSSVRLSVCPSNAGIDSKPSSPAVAERPLAIASIVKFVERNLLLLVTFAKIYRCVQINSVRPIFSSSWSIVHAGCDCDKHRFTDASPSAR